MKGQTSKRILEPKLQRALRRNMSDAERRLWSFLRRQQVAKFRFRRQHPFGNYILDFVCLEAMLAVEVDGGQHSDRRSADETRTALLRKAGVRVLRFWNNDVLKDTEAVLESIRSSLRA